MKRNWQIIFSILLISSISLGISAGQIQSDSRTVEIKGFSFQPGSINIPVGTTVTWVNNDSADHTVTSEDGTFNSGDLMSGGVFRFVFSQSGTHRYRCSIHPFMTGVITVVQDQPSNAQPTMTNPNTMQPSPAVATDSMKNVTAPAKSAARNATQATQAAPTIESNTSKTAANAVSNVTKTQTPAAKQPGFEGILSITGLLATGYLLSSRKR